MTVSHKPRSQPRGRREATLREDGTGYTCRGCQTSWTALTLAHCAAPGCHQSFENATLFDLHRRRGRCLDPAKITDEMGSTVMVKRGGIWRSLDTQGIIPPTFLPGGDHRKGARNMATIRRITKLDDLEMAEGSQEVAADETVEFGLDGVQYEIDLCAENAKMLRETLAEYIEVAKRVDSPSEIKTRPRKRTVKPDKEQTQAIRNWAKANGYSIGDRGRIPQEVRDAYHAS